MPNPISTPFIPPARKISRRSLAVLVRSRPEARLRLAALRRRTFGVVLVVHFMSPREVQQL